MDLKEEFRFLKGFGRRKVLDKDRPWRRAKDIIQSGFFYGCSDAARVLFFRATQLGIPARFMAMIDCKSSNEHNIIGHCYVELFLNDSWVIVDPIRCQIVENYPEKYILVTTQIDWPSFEEFVRAHRVKLRQVS